MIFTKYSGIYNCGIEFDILKEFWSLTVFYTRALLGPRRNPPVCYWSFLQSFLRHFVHRTWYNPNICPQNMIQPKYLSTEYDTTQMFVHRIWYIWILIYKQSCTFTMCPLCSSYGWPSGNTFVLRLGWGRPKSLWVSNQWKFTPTAKW